MKLNTECVRDVLLALEDNLRLDYKGDIVPFCTSDLAELEALSKYPESEILYTVKKLEEGGFLETRPDTEDPAFGWFMGDCGITYKGHEFIASIRPQPVWLKVGKKVAKASGSVALNVLAALAEEAAKELCSGSDQS